uniref:transposase domain-containing protein n=1 Tax=Escherichia coli TaxID=562 RepID=UPI001FCE7C1A
MLPSETMIWQPEFTDKTLSRKPGAVQKAWLFAGSLMAGNRAAQIMSLLETAKRNGLEPHAWLTDVLTRLPEWPEDRLEELLPLEGFTFSG